jgi:hypothetical protein
MDYVGTKTRDYSLINPIPGLKPFDPMFHKPTT